MKSSVLVFGLVLVAAVGGLGTLACQGEQEPAEAFFPGTYTVFVHVSVTVPDKNLGAAEVKAGQKTVLKHSAG